MHVVVPGQEYELQNLKSDSVTSFNFYMDEAIHGESRDGPSSQEVTRMLIDRVQVLNLEKPWWGNDLIVQKYREAIALFEMRALYMRAEKGYPIELMPVNSDGHLIIGGRHD